MRLCNLYDVCLQVLCVQTRPYSTGAIVTNVYQLGRHSSMPLLSFFLEVYYQASVSSLETPAAAQRPRLHPAPPAAALGVPIPSKALAAPCPPRLSWLVSPQHRAPDAGIAATLDAATWSFHGQGLTMVDSCQFASVTPEDGWSGTFRSGFCRWFAACRMERVDVCWALVRTIGLPPKPVRAQVSRPALFLCDVYYLYLNPCSFDVYVISSPCSFDDNVYMIS